MPSNSQLTAVIYPGSFDPLTNGHLDIIERARNKFGKVTVAIAHNPQKSHTFDLETRIRLVEECVRGIPNVEVDSFLGLLVDYAAKKNVWTVLRGLRAFSDFEYEFQLATMNRQLDKRLETIFMMTSENCFYLSSRLVREVASFGANVQAMVPPCVYDALVQKFAKGS